MTDTKKDVLKFNLSIAYISIIIMILSSAMSSERLMVINNALEHILYYNIFLYFLLSNFTYRTTKSKHVMLNFVFNCLYHFENCIGLIMKSLFVNKIFV